MKLFVLVILSWSNLICAQDNQEDAINSIFSSNGTFGQFYEEVTPPPLKSIGSLSKCGEGVQKNRFVCVPYYNCNADTNIVEANPDLDGTNKINIRMNDGDEAPKCDHYLEVCCQLPNGDNTNGGTPPTRPTQPSGDSGETGGDRTVTKPGSTGTGGTGTGGTGTGGTGTGSTGTGGTGTGGTGTGGTGTGSTGTGGTGTGGTGTGGTGTGGNPTNPTRRVNCGGRNPQGLDFNLVGGTNEASFGEFPWMVALLRKNPSPTETLSICGGSLIGPRLVLTGAHCLKSVDISEIKIRAGEWDTQTQNERIPYQERNVVQKIVHEHFSKGNLYNDVALLVLDRPLTKTDSVGTVCLPEENQHFDSSECFATGWGKDVFGQEGKYAVILKKLQLPLVQNQKCQRALRKTRLGDIFILHRSFICAGGEPNLDTCTGDGGSPLVCPDPRNPSRYLQVGIVAWGIGCGENRLPGVYADVASFRNWIDTKVQELGISTDSYTL